MRSWFAISMVLLLGAAPAAAVVPPQQLPSPQLQVPQQTAHGPLDDCEAREIRSLLRDQVVPDFRGCTLEQVRALMEADRIEGQLNQDRFAIDPVEVAALGNPPGIVTDQMPAAYRAIGSLDGQPVRLDISAAAEPVPTPAPVRASGTDSSGVDGARGAVRSEGAGAAPGPFEDPLVAGAIAAGALLGGGLLLWRIVYWLRPDPIVVIREAGSGAGAGAAAPPFEARGGIGAEGGEPPSLVGAAAPELPAAEIEVGLGAPELVFVEAPELIEEGYEDE